MRDGQREREREGGDRECVRMCVCVSVFVVSVCMVCERGEVFKWRMSLCGIRSSRKIDDFRLTKYHFDKQERLNACVCACVRVYVCVCV